MRIDKCAEIAGNIVDNAAKQISKNISQDAPDAKTVQVCSSDIAGNYGKATAQLSSNTTTSAEKELSELEKLFTKLEEKGKRVIKFSEDNDEMEVIFYHGKHHDYFKARDGKIFKIRYSKDKAYNKTMVAVAKAYEERGLKVPTTISVNINGKRGIASQLMTNLTDKSANPQECYKFFGTDVLFAHRNAYSKGTTMINQDDVPVRLSVSGTAGYRVRGEKRYDYSDDLVELRTFLDPRVNAESAEFLKDMTRDDMLKSIEIACKNYAPTIEGDNYVLSHRRDNLNKFYMRASLTPQKQGENLLEYVTRVQNKIIEVKRENVEYANKLRERVNGFEVAQNTWRYDPEAFTQADKDNVLKFIDLAEQNDDVPKALYERWCSRDELKSLAKMQFEEHDSSKNIQFISISDEPEVFSRVLYSPHRSTQPTLDELASFSRNYCSMRSGLSSGNAGERIIFSKGLLEKFYKGEISFEDFRSLGYMSSRRWEIAEQRNLFSPLEGMDKPLSPSMISSLTNLSDEDYTKILSRPEVLRKIPNRSEELSGEYLYTLAKLTDEEYQRVLKYHLLEDIEPGNNKRLFDKDGIETLAKCTDEQLDVAISRGLLKHKPELEPKKGLLNWNSQLYGSEIRELAKLSDEEYNRVLARGMLSGDYDTFKRDKVMATAQFSDWDFERLKIYGIKTSFEHDDWNAGQLKQILELDDISRINQLERINKAYSCGMSKDSILSYAQLDEKTYNKSLELLQNKKLSDYAIKYVGAKNAALLTDAEWSTLRRRGLLDPDNKPFADMDVLFKKSYISDEELEKDPTVNALSLLARIPDDKWELFKRHGLLTTNPNRGQLGAYSLYQISKLSNEDFNKLLKTKIFSEDFYPSIHEGGYPFDSFHHTDYLIRICKEFDENEIEIMEKNNIFRGTKFDKYYSPYHGFYTSGLLKKLVKFTPEQFENYHLFNEKIGSSTHYWLSINMANVFKNKTEIQRILDRHLISYSDYFEGCDGGANRLNIIQELSKLTDKEWKYVEPLFNHYHMYTGGSERLAINPGKAVAELDEIVNGRKHLYEFSLKEKRILLNKLIRTGGIECSYVMKSLLPEGTIIPRTFYRRNLLVNELINSIGGSSKTLTDSQIANFMTDLSKMAQKDSGIMSTNFDLMNVNISNHKSIPRLLYSKDKFSKDVMAQLEGLSEIDKRRLFDYFSFEIQQDPLGKFVLNGYPNPSGNVSNNFDKLDTPELITAAEKIRPLLEKFVNTNKVFVDGNPKLEAEMNKILEVFPEFATVIGKVQHKTHDFTVDVHIMKVLQGVMEDPRYQKLSDKDKVVMQISTILHDLTKAERAVDKSHPSESAFDAYYIVNRLNLPREDKLKIYEIIKNHDWLEKLNKRIKISKTEYRDMTPAEYDKVLRQVAFAHRQNDCFEMAAILTKADLKGVKANDEFYHIFGRDYKDKMADVQKLVDELKKTAISIPQTIIPKASELVEDGDIVRKVTKDGITNTVIYLRPGQDLSKVGFGEGVTTEDLNFIVHALDYEEQSTIFRALGIVDSDALLSSSWVNFLKQNYKVFRKQGYILKVDADDIHAGTYKDFGSGYKKDYDTLLQEYLFHSRYSDRTDVRKYWSKQIKEKFGLDDESYKDFNEMIKNKSFTQIRQETPDIALKIQEIVDEMDVLRRKGGRNYNEWLISRPEIQGGFFWGSDFEKIGVDEVPLFIREYLAEHNLPLIYFGK